MPFLKKISVVAVSSILTAGVVHAVEPTPEDWFDAGRQTVIDAKHLTQNERHAKNVILFVGDGMGVSTITASRIFDGQQKGGHGEENSLSFEKLPYLALSKTYSVDQQTPDSAPTMTAMVTGVKTIGDSISVNQFVAHSEPDANVVDTNKLTTILEQSKQQGLSVGVVSTARITHATPAATYAHTANRDWESDSDKPAGATVPDIAAQLVDFNINGGIDVALGGGRTRFIPKNLTDPEYGVAGKRKDGRDLTTEWVSNHANAQYVWNKAQFDAIDPNTTDHLLGLFEPSHVHYEADRVAHDKAGEPSLTEMTTKAIDILKKNHNGYFLMVEGGRIDHAHHSGNAYRALSDTQQLAAAVKAAMNKTNPEDTLIIVTADHSHVFTIGGYPQRGNPILGLTQGVGATTPDLDMLGLPYTTLNYANGTGYTGKSNFQAEGPKSFNAATGAWSSGSEGHNPSSFLPANGRPTLNDSLVQDPNYLQEAIIPLSAETHAAEDVAIFAGGPKAHLFHGVVEQNVIYHVMAEALGLAEHQEDKHEKHEDKPEKHGK
ncbi:alkaline phosphatase [Methylobacter tundripaludum]|uniref:Alkaline phosphatase n=1 Tax=Methylobacter tundripaludum (strain ATCC BAA-1195 / DSM 17260 / SV96) TaxID=697282 RepID=G3IY61_METTV|nr:alkaline phosphatase [Methylobacter tundripaludum]EGW19983.1 Alkaline phosphatase [Methylobacter tundripaludum SV96]